MKKMLCSDYGIVLMFLDDELPQKPVISMANRKFTETPVERENKSQEQLDEFLDNLKREKKTTFKP
jgi:hypothetical protein